MRMTATGKPIPVPNGWDRRGLPGWTYCGLFPNTVFVFTPEGAQFYHDIPRAKDETRVDGRLCRHPHETREARAARYLATRIDRATSAEDQQLSIWSNESMNSTAFDDFHLSDLEYGVRAHHDEIRRLLPVTRPDDAPDEDRIDMVNEDLRSAGTNLA
jgi:phenylpropionate dioxygenase-like ring-hydroxylating dioxygenase large terminal subunit